MEKFFRNMMTMAAEKLGQGGDTDACSDREVQTLFKDFDTDKDGYITPVELDRALKRLGITPSPLELSAMFKAADKDKDGKINLTEFKDLVHNCPALQSLQQAFRQFDLDGDGHITMEELRKVIIELGQRASEVEIQAMFQAADVNKDGKITFEEFAQMMRGRPLVLNLREVFRQFDIDNDGSITEAELRVVCKELNISATDREVNVMFTVADENGDGKISFEEFSRLLTKKQ